MSEPTPHRFTRYAEVLAALRDPRLAPDPGNQPHLRESTIEALSAAHLAEWQTGMLRAAVRFPHTRSVEVVGDFVQPYCASVAQTVTKTYPDESVYAALNRTLAAVLANGWLALVEHPDQFALLRRDAALVPKAVEEMLRLAGVPRDIFRTAAESFDFAGKPLETGERIVLDIAAANRDPAEFPDPARFDLTRRNAAHLALGFGPHGCVGAVLIRRAAAIATEAFVSRFTAPAVDGEVEWITRSQFSYVSSFRLLDGT